MCGRIVGCCIRDCPRHRNQKSKEEAAQSMILSKSVGLRISICNRNSWSYWDLLAGWAVFLCFLGFDTSKNIVESW